MIDQKKIEPQLAMVRHLEDLEEVKLPPGYDLKHYRPGDAGAWEAIISEAFGREIKFENTMRYDYPYRPERIQFITWNGIPVATASAWYRPKWGRNTGYLHMVGVRSEHAGHRLGYLVSLAALKLMVQEKRDRAVLNTDDFRIPALKTYLRLGFKPLLYHENQRERWEHIFEETGYHHLCEKYSFILNGPLYIPVEEKADSDSPENYSPARRWYPDRPHKLGTGNIDSLGDESLYKPSKLGSASVSPAEITAGSKDCLRLSYTSGPDGLARGTKIIFYIGGQNALTVQARKKNNTSGDDWPFERLQTVPVKAYGPPDTELDVSQKPAKQVEVRIAEGRLGPGDTIHIQAGPDEGFPWTPLAGRYETKVIIDPGNGEPKQRLESPLVIRVLPRELHQLETVVSSTHNGNMGIKMVTTARDIFDNRVPLSGDIQICGNGESISAHMENGFCGVTLEPEKFRTIRFKTVHTESGISTESNPSPRLSGKQLYIGDLHVHDFMSAAWGYTDEIYRWAKEDRNLDFVSIPVQVHGWLDNEKWTIAKFMNERHLDEGNFVTLLANEWQHTGYADKVIHFLGGDQPYFCVDDSRYSSAQKL
ncbi:MAG: GNAT family N-acetyltransferase, partial [Spirochaetia bacterium]